MNLYRITYTTASGDTASSNITERTEKAAIRELKAYHKGNGYPIQDITSTELIRTNATATKQQERDALEAIKRMVEELGPDSYLKTAFDGCFTDAEQNIDDDAAYSMKDRYEHSEARLKAAQEEIAELKKSYAEGYTEWSETASADMETIKALRERVLSADDLTDISQLLAGKVLDLGKEVSNAAERIVEGAAQPESASFQNAVKDHRAAKADLEYYTALLTRVNAIAKAGA